MMTSSSWYIFEYAIAFSNMKFVSSIHPHKASAVYTNYHDTVKVHVHMTTQLQVQRTVHGHQVYKAVPVRRAATNDQLHVGDYIEYEFLTGKGIVLLVTQSLELQEEKAPLFLLERTVMKLSENADVGLLKDDASDVDNPLSNPPPSESSCTSLPRAFDSPPCGEPLLPSTSDKKLAPPFDDALSSQDQALYQPVEIGMPSHPHPFLAYEANLLSSRQMK